MKKTEYKGYTEVRALNGGMDYDEDKHCPECGCAWYGNKNLLGEGSRVCFDCDQDWWIDIEYDNPHERREIPSS